MKKKLLTVVLAASVTAMMLAGCGNTAPAVKKEQLYRELIQAGESLMQKIRDLEGHSNAEIKSLTGKIRTLMK